MSTHAKPPRKDQYTVGWICAIPEERAAANAMLDEIYESTQNQDPYDTNHYSFGRVKNHNVVIASLPAGQYGTSPAATVANQMLRSYSSIKIRLMVGIGGGVPTPDYDIRLGDVVVSQPKDRFGGVVQYDRGKKTAGGRFERTGQLDKPPQLLLNALASMQGEIEFQGFDLGKYLRENLKNQRMLDNYGRPHEKDDLYQAEYDHVGEDRECIRCDRGKLVRRYPRSPKDVNFHYGTIASGNLVMKNGTERDKISRDLGGILCFEMEAAGLMDNFPCLVIRGICDYADSHKNKGWQRYAALTAAAYAKKLLSTIPGIEQPAGQQHGLQLDGFLPRFAEMPAQQRSSPLSPYTSGLGQPTEQSRGLPSDQLPSGFFNPYDPYASPPRSHQPSPQPRGSPFNQSTSGYSHSSSPYDVSPSSQLGQGTGWLSAYPSAATDKGSFEGSPSTLSRPSLTPNWTGHSDSNWARFRGNSTISVDTEKTAVDSQLGGSEGYLQSTQMTYPQHPKPSHLDRSRQPSNSHSTQSIPLRPLPPSKSGQMQPQALGAQASRSLDASHQGRGHAVARKQVATKPQSKVQLDQSLVRAQQLLEKDHKIPSYSNNPNPTVSAHKENCHGKAAETPIQNHRQQSHAKGAKPSTEGGQEQSHHYKNPKPPTKGGQEQSHQHNNSNPSENSAHDDHPEKTKPPPKRHTVSAPNKAEAAQPGPGSVVPEDNPYEYNSGETSSNIRENSSESNIEPDYYRETNHNNINEEDRHRHHTAPLNGQGIPAEGRIDPSYAQKPSLYGQAYPSNGQESHGFSPYSHLGYPSHNEEYLSHRQKPSASDELGVPFDDQQYHGHGQERSEDHSSYGQEHHPYDQQHPSPYNNYHTAGNDADRPVGGKADDYFLSQDMGEHDYMANQAMAASAHDQNTTFDRPVGVEEECGGDDSSSDGKGDHGRYEQPIERESARNAGQFHGEEEADGDCCGCFGGWCGDDEGKSDDGCCGCFGGWCGDDEGKSDDGCCGCFGGCCGGDERERDDGEGSCGCIIM